MEGTNSNDGAKEPYGIHPMFKSSWTKPAPQPKLCIPLKDCVTNSEAMLLGFIAEKNLHFADVPDLVELIKTLAKDGEALSQLNMDRTTASYKKKHGVAKTINDTLTNALRNNFFSLNLVEATSKTSKHVLSILASYYSPDDSQVVVKHLHSCSVVQM